MTPHELESLVMLSREASELHKGLDDAVLDVCYSPQREALTAVENMALKARGLAGALRIFVDRVEKRRGR